MKKVENNLANSLLALLREKLKRREGVTPPYEAKVIGQLPKRAQKTQ
jgi:hypothetical protein